MSEAEKDGLMMFLLHENLTSGYETFNDVWFALYEYHSPDNSCEFERAFYKQFNKREIREL